MTEETVEYVLMESTRRAIEKIATDFARDMLSDEEFRKQMREEAHKAARAIALSLRRA